MIEKGSEKFRLREGDLDLATLDLSIVHFGNSGKTVLDVVKLHQSHALFVAAQDLHCLNRAKFLKEVLEIVLAAGLSTQGGDMNGVAWRIDGD